MTDRDAAALAAHLADHKNRHWRYVMIPSSTTELQAEVDELEAKLLQVRHLVEWIWECPESHLANMTPGDVADNLDKILDPEGPQ